MRASDSWNWSHSSELLTGQCANAGSHGQDVFFHGDEQLTIADGGRDAAPAARSGHCSAVASICTPVKPRSETPSGLQRLIEKPISRCRADPANKAREENYAMPWSKMRLRHGVRIVWCTTACYSNTPHLEVALPYQVRPVRCLRGCRGRSRGRYALSLRFIDLDLPSSIRARR